jgi:hypothetical protein
MLAAVILLATGTSFAADVYLKATSYSKTLPGGATVPMWGFVACDPDFVTNCSGPAPQINLPAGAHTFHLSNTLPVPVSLVIPGQAGGGLGSPTKIGGRVQSFTAEAAPNGPPATYNFNLRSGTYVYQSGTLPSIQVAMGLYGALIVGGNATDKVLLFSEIDPVQNYCANKAAFGIVADPNDPARCRLPDYPATVNYTPTYFLINGNPFDPATATNTFDVGLNAGMVLFRFLNAGLQSHTPTFLGLEMSLIAEDGNLYQGGAKQQNSVLLAAGKMLDVLVTPPAADATYPLFDRMLDLTNDNKRDGGMLAYLKVGAGSQVVLPQAYDDEYSIPTDALYTSTHSVLANDNPGFTGVVLGATNVQHGTLTLNTDGTFSYTPSAGYQGPDTFTYVAQIGAVSYNAALVTLNVTFTNHAPTGNTDAYSNNVTSTIIVDKPGVLGNDVDADGDKLTAAIVGTAPGGLTLNADGSFTYSGLSTTFQYQACDSKLLCSAPVDVTLTVSPVSGVQLVVLGPAGPITDYRWLVEEDATYPNNPAAPAPNAQSFGANLHKSYMPVVAQGCVGPTCIAPQTPLSQVVLDPAKRYFVSVLPNDGANPDGHTLGGVQIPAGANANTTITVNVNQQPIPPAQIAVLVFEDTNPTNGAPDGGERGLGGFQLTLIDSGGRYGISGGPMEQDAFGNPLKNYLPCAPPAPEGVILTCPDGSALIKNLAPHKYTLTAVPPAGGEYSQYKWSQTTTIEGTRGIDAWVRADEPPYFQEWGASGWHVFFGFVSPERLPARSGTSTITGKVTNIHMYRPPSLTEFDSGSYDALAFTNAWVGLNAGNGAGPIIAAVKAKADGTFSIPNVSDGLYQLVVWDEYLDQIISYHTVNVAGSTNMGNVPVFAWFARQEFWVFEDLNENGIWDAGERPIPDEPVDIRFRDGSVYQASTTDFSGYYSFDEIFPFFNWQVAEVGYTRFKPTGVTVTVDAGGDNSGGPYPGVVNPATQTENCTDAACTSRTETGPVLLQGFQVVEGQTNILQWGKAPYKPGENGGIVGIVFYASTRAESNPRLGVGDPWEPGIPRVKVRLYRVVGTADGGTGLVFVDETLTDSWDDNPPAGCLPDADPVYVNLTLGGDPTKCYDGWRNWNQVRPAVFDGGYAFGSAAGKPNLPPGKYVVEIVVPPGYDLVKEEDVNVGFGETFAPADIVLPNMAMVAIAPDQATIQAAFEPEPGLFQPPCVGEQRVVPDYLTLFPSAMEPAPFAGALRPLCNRKQVVLADQSQANSDFFLFTSVPVAAHHATLITDDVNNDPTPGSVNYGEKMGPPFLPVAFRDHTGKEVARVYADQWGRANGLLPSTINANIPNPSGYSAAMWISCMNDPGPIPGPNGTLITDPNYNPMYMHVCYSMNYMPGTTTYLDTPVIATSAFPGHNPPDCTYPDATPAIRQVDGDGIGPFLSDGGPRRLTIYSQGMVQVPNPAYAGPTAPAPYNVKAITRDFGFGATPGANGKVTINGQSLVINSWNDGMVEALVPPGITTGQLEVTRDNGKKTITSVTVTVEDTNPLRVPTAAYPTIQAAIDAAAPGSLILVGPGTYEELAVMWKPLRLQGAGAGATIIDAKKWYTTGKTAKWKEKITSLIPDTNSPYLLPGQSVGPWGMELFTGTLAMEEGPGITVLGIADPKTSPLPPAGGYRLYPSRIDGFSIVGGDMGGGIYVNGWAHGLEVSNNSLRNNMGMYHAGMRVGRPYDPRGNPGADNLYHFNDNVNVHHNTITQNGGFEFGGGGLTLCTGSNYYNVSQNFVCGNFSMANGAGIAHLGLSDGGLIADNRVLFNQSYNQGLNRHGGGLLISGEPGVAGALTLGSGNVTVNANLIQANDAGTGHGGGIRTQFVNGADVQRNTGFPASWYQVTITNNMIVNNVAGWSGAGISLQDTVHSSVINNTIVNNDSFATVGNVFEDPNTSTPQPAGIASELHTTALAGVLPNGQARFSSPTLTNNIIWHNRSFHYDATGGTPRLKPDLTQTSVGACHNDAQYWDTGVLGQPLQNPTLKLNPTYSILSSTAGYDATNVSTAPPLLNAYCNGARSLSLNPPRMQSLPAIDEGGNFITIYWGPLTPMGNYHITSATDAGSLEAAPSSDFDAELRVQPIDRGADDVGGPAPIVLAAPWNLRAAANGAARIDLTWTDNSADEQGFRIQRATDNWFTSNLTSFQAGANINTYSDNTVQQASTYYYRVFAFNAAGDSRPSNTATASTPGGAPAAPSNLTAVEIKPSAVKLRWTDNSTNETGFYVQRSEDSGAAWRQVGRLNANKTTYEEERLRQRTTYLYRVQAYNAHGVSDFSNTLTLTTGTNFQLAIAGPATVRVSPGQAGTFALNINPAPEFSGQITFACAGAPRGTTCVVTPASVTVGGGAPVDVTVTLTTTRGAAGMQTAATGMSGWPGWPAATLGFLGLMAIWPLAFARRLMPAFARVACVGLLLAASVFLVSCGGGGGTSTTPAPVAPDTGTPSGNYVLTVTATSGDTTEAVDLYVAVN